MLQYTIKIILLFLVLKLSVLHPLDINADDPTVVNKNEYLFFFNGHKQVIVLLGKNGKSYAIHDSKKIAEIFEKLAVNIPKSSDSKNNSQKVVILEHESSLKAKELSIDKLLEGAVPIKKGIFDRSQIPTSHSSNEPQKYPMAPTTITIPECEKDEILINNKCEKIAKHKKKTNKNKSTGK
jgi:hypothetical protein